MPPPWRAGHGSANLKSPPRPQLSRRWYPRVYFAQPQKGLAHRALSDILESIRELRYYRRTVFVPPPGPSTDEAQAAAAEVLTGGRGVSPNASGGVPT